jgi:hypothetical protein
MRGRSDSWPNPDGSVHGIQQDVDDVPATSRCSGMCRQVLDMRQDPLVDAGVEVCGTRSAMDTLPSVSTSCADRAWRPRACLRRRAGVRARPAQR